MASAFAHTVNPITTPSVPSGGDEALGAAIGTIKRTYGLLTCEEIVRVTGMIDRSGDLAVADRIAFVCAGRMRAQLAVFEYEGWFHVGRLDRFLSVEQAATLKTLQGSPRLLSIVDAKGITPIVGPLAGAVR